MTLQQFVDKWLGRKADFDGAYGGQCVDLFRFYCKEVLDINQPRSVQGAADFWQNYETDPNLKNNFLKIKNTPDFLPQPGDVMLWTRRAGGGYGHVAIILEATLSEFISLDQNWPTLSKVTKTTHDYVNVYGVLRPLQTTEGNTTPGKYSEEEMTKVRLERDENHNKYVEQKQRADSLQTELDQVKTIADQRKKELSDFIEELAKRLALPATSDKGDIVGGVERLLSVEDQLSKVQKENTQLEKRHELEKSELKEEIKKLRSENESIRLQAEKLTKQNETMEQRINQLEQRLESHKQAEELTTRFALFIQSVKKYFERK